MEQISPLERSVLSLLLEGDHPALPALRKQVASCQVTKRAFTGAGFVTELHVPSEVPSVPLRDESIRFGDVIAEVIGLEAGAGFVLYVDKGRITALEGYTFGEPWPAEVEVNSFDYSTMPRDFSPLDVESS